jgi:apolipoprotein N-acyltransferase
MDCPPNVATLASPAAHAVVLAFGWRRAALAFAAGALCALGLAPIDAWPVLFVGFPVLVLLVDGAGAGRLGGVVSAAVSGWWFGFGYFLVGLYWIGFAFLVDAATFAWMMPFAVVALPAALALFPALGLGLARALWTPGPIRILTLALALTAAEWLRGHVLTGFPWNAFGYALTGSLALAQGAALLGLWGLTLFAVYLFASPAVLFDDPAPRPGRWAPPAGALVLLVCLFAYGTARLSSTPTAFVPGVHLRLMQPNLPQDEKFNYAARKTVMERYLALSDRATGPDAMGIKDVTHLIWPESAFPFFLTRQPDALAQIADFLGERTVLLTGAARLAAPVSGKALHAYNSIYVIDHDGSIGGVYDKVHLVPFGEYLPFQPFMESLGVTQLTKMPGGFLAGEHHGELRVPGAPAVLPLICYEIVFPDEVAASGGAPGWILNLTNDGWFGLSPGPYQHFRQAQVRAIEQGLPLVRAANTGISAVTDALGRVIKELPLGAEGVLDAPLPQPVAPPLSARARTTLFELAFAAGVLLVLRRRWHRS